MSIFKQVADKARTSLSNFMSSVDINWNEKKVDDEHRKQLEKDAESMQLLLSDPRYGAMQRYLTEIEKSLETILHSVLTADWADYSRERRADRASIVSAQISVIKAIREYPEHLIKMIEERK